jgi:hypothetical protein
VSHSPFDVLSSIDSNRAKVFVGWCDGDLWVSFYCIEDGILDCRQVGDWQLFDEGGADGVAIVGVVGE